MNDPILVGGAGRSGTTLMAMILDSHPRIMLGTELHYTGNMPLKPLDKQFVARAKRFGLTLQEIESKVRGLFEKEMASRP